MSTELPLPDFAAFESPLDFVRFVSQIFTQQKYRIRKFQNSQRVILIKPEPFDAEYARASATMNQELRKRCEEGGTPQEQKIYCWAYAYWWNRTNMLEALCKSKLGNLKEKKDIERGGDTLIRLVKGEKTERDLHPAFIRLLDRLTKAQPEVLLKTKGEEL